MGARAIIAAACVGAGFLIASGPAIAPTEADRALYAAAVTYCRSKPGELVLNSDKSIFCFDGDVTREGDTSSLEELNSGGLFVVRSRGGLSMVAARLATLIEERKATVVVYDYCFSACASFFLIASARTYVMKDTIVAWHYGSERRYICDEFGTDYLSIDGTWYPTRERCYEHTEGISKGFRKLRLFFRQRIVDPDRHDFVVAPPMSKHIEAMLGSKRWDIANFEGAWMWNPRYYKAALKTEVIYEKYPESQDEVDALVHRFLGKRAGSKYILHDP